MKNLRNLIKNLKRRAVKNQRRRGIGHRRLQVARSLHLHHLILKMKVEINREAIKRAKHKSNKKCKKLIIY